MFSPAELCGATSSKHTTTQRRQLRASVSEKGRELAKVLEWNEEYGEVKKKRPDTSAHHLSMYL